MLFDTGDVLKITGLARHKFDQWRLKNFIKPAILPKRRGHRSQYSINNLVHILIIDELGEAGLTLPLASEIAMTASVISSSAEQEGIPYPKVAVNLQNTNQGVILDEVSDTDWKYYIIVDIDEAIRTAIKGIKEHVDPDFAPPPLASKGKDGEG